ncbi:MAG TPA: YceH family protein [Acidisarcina sp.]
MEPKLNGNEVRVLGCLVEKAISTPDYYPLSLNALVNACNQRSNRDPFLNLGEDDVLQALHTLGDKGLAAGAPSSGRVAKYEHRLPEVFNFGRREEAVLCVLLLRGPQTPGELRSRTERLFAFEDTADVLSTLERLARREPPMVASLTRQPGTKEARYAHLFSGDVEATEAAVRLPPIASAPGSARLDALEAEVARLREEVDELRSRLVSLAPDSLP